MDAYNVSAEHGTFQRPCCRFKSRARNHRGMPPISMEVQGHR